MFNLYEFVTAYYKAFRDIISAIPSTGRIPEFLRDTSFVIAQSEVTGKVAIELTSRQNVTEINWNGEKLTPQSDKEPGFLISSDLKALEQYIFPQDDSRKSVAITIHDRYVVLDRLAFSSREYNEKYWSDVKFYRNCEGSIPFIVTETGSMLGLNILWGTELGGERRERLFEYIKIYGSTDMLPKDGKELEDEVFRDFCLATSRDSKIPPNWSFTDFLSGLKENIENNVLLLGSYKSEKDFECLKTALNELGYNGFLLKESPDIPIQSNLEKLITAIICSSFIIVIDKEASGHIEPPPV